MTINGIKPLKTMNCYVVHMKHIDYISTILQFKKESNVLFSLFLEGKI